MVYLKDVSPLCIHLVVQALKVRCVQVYANVAKQYLSAASEGSQGISVNQLYSRLTNLHSRAYTSFRREVPGDANSQVLPLACLVVCTDQMSLERWMDALDVV